VKRAKAKAKPKAKPKTKAAARRAKAPVRKTRRPSNRNPPPIVVDVQNNWIRFTDRLRLVNGDGTETVTWVCRGGDMTITWANGRTPFDPLEFQGPPQSQIGPVAVVNPPPAGTPPFDYTITITPRVTPTAVVKIDPQVEVDDGFNPLRKRLARDRGGKKRKK